MPEERQRQVRPVLSAIQGVDVRVQHHEKLRQPNLKRPKADSENPCEVEQEDHAIQKTELALGGCRTGRGWVISDGGTGDGASSSAIHGGRLYSRRRDGQR